MIILTNHTSGKIRNRDFFFILYAVHSKDTYVTSLSHVYTNSVYYILRILIDLGFICKKPQFLTKSNDELRENLDQKLYTFLNCIYVVHILSMILCIKASSYPFFIFVCDCFLKVFQNLTRFDNFFPMNKNVNINY